MTDTEDVIHLVNSALGWQLRETASGALTDGQVSEELQRDPVRQMAQWLGHFPERLPEMEARTAAGREALSVVRKLDLPDGRRRW